MNNKGFFAQAGLAAVIAGAGGVMLPAPVFAQATAASDDADAGLEEIVVTAQRRRENLQDVPISVTAITANNLAAGGIQGLSQISQVVPSVQITRSGPGAIFFIRGVGNSSGGTGEEGANAFYLDGVYLGDLTQAATDFNNIERIEVLKGPQGTLFGRNSTGGLVHVITRDPGDQVVVKANIGAGNYKTYQGQVYVASPLTDKVGVDIALAAKDQNKGFGTNFATGKDIQKGWHVAMRSKLVFRPGDDTKISFAGDYRRSRDDYTNGFNLFRGVLGTGGASYLGAYNLNTVDPAFAKVRIWGLALNVEHEFDWATLTSITARRDLRTVSALDTDYVPAQLVRAFITAGSKTFQQELRLASASDNRFKWQGGLFYYQAIANVFNQQVRGLNVGGVNSGFDLQSRMKTTSYAAFGEGSYDLTDTTHLTAGIRYTKDKRAFRARQVAVNQTNPVLQAAFTIAPLQRSISFGRATWRLAVRQDLTDDVNVYASYNRGFKSGIFAMQSPANPPVKPQTIDAFEIGVKSQLLDNMLRLNLAGFHYKIKDFQVRSASAATSVTALLLNAATVKVDGLEAEIELAPTRGLRLMANGVYLKSRFASFPGNQFFIPRPAVCNNPGGNPPGVTTGPLTGGFLACFGDAAGNRVPLSPRFAGNVGFSYRAPVGREGEITLTGLWNYSSRIYFEADNFLSQPSYSVFNASLEYRPSPNWGIELWAKNIGDKQYAVAGASGGTGAFENLAAPRTYGVNLKFDF